MTCLLFCRYWRDKLDTLIEFPIEYVILPFCHTPILSYTHSVIHPFCHTPILSYYHSTLFLSSGLDLRKYVQAQDEPEPVYDLFAVSNHFGGMGGGHCKLSW